MAHDIALVIFDWAGTVIDFGCLAPRWCVSAGFRRMRRRRQHG